MSDGQTVEASSAVADPAAALFAPFAVRGLHLKNRIVMSPMTRSFSPGGVPTAAVAAYYRRRAENDVGLIITEGTVVGHAASSNDLNVPRFHGDDALEAWRTVLAGVHAAGGRMMPQLWHVGSVRKPADSPNSHAASSSPSGLRKPGVAFGEPMTDADIGEVIDAFARSAADAMRIGFDGIELHGAHGYLIDQFLWGDMNRRDDRYGGDAVQRTRFAAEIVQACRRATSPGFPISLRVSQWKQQDYRAMLAATPDDLAALLAPLAEAGVDIFHCSTRRFWEPAFAGSDLNLAGWAKKLTGKAVITVGSVGLDTDMNAAFRGENASVVSIDRVCEMVARGEVDLVAVGRALLGDPEWARKIRMNRLGELRAFAASSLKILH